jgi:hypothetical protein
MRGVQWFAPPVAKIRVEPRIGGVPGHARFEVEFAPEIRGPVARVHLGDVEFTYQDTHQTGDMIEIVPRLYPTWEAAGQGETDAGAGDAGAGGDGAAEAGALGEAEAPLGSLGDVGGVGVVRVLSADPIRFLRGNVTSQVGGLDISAAQRILSFLYLGGNRLPCERAADLNGNNLVDQGDALWLLHMLFHNGPDPVAGPYPEPGFEPAAASPLSCDVPFPYFAPLAEDEE